MGDSAQILREVGEVARGAGAIALNYYGRVSADIKADASYVTEADRRVEEFIRRELRSRFPDDAIIGEETDDELSSLSDYTWAIDPIDGTTNFVAGLPHWAICIARLKGRAPVAGVVNLPVLDELFAGAEGAGATLNGRALAMSRELPPENEQLLAVWSTAMNHVRMRGYTGKFRTLGSTVVKLVYLARGSYVGALTPHVKIWDVAAGLPILWEAGGASWNLDGTPFREMDLTPGEGYGVPPLVHAVPGNETRLFDMAEFHW